MSAPPHVLAEIDQLAPSWAEIDLAVLRSNARRLQALAGDASLMAVVKADAYGHGAVPVARTLLREGIEHFGVATLPEAIALRNAGILAPILVFGAPLPEVLTAYSTHHIDVAVSSGEIAQAVTKRAQEGHSFRVHVKVDTGMGRIGIAPAEAAPIIRDLASIDGVDVVGVWSHLATGTGENDPFAGEQLNRLKDVWDRAREVNACLHIAHTGALVAALPLIAPPERTIVRCGIGLYGYHASPLLKDVVPLNPVMRFISRVTHVKTIQRGETVSYGRTWRASCPARIATVGAGYADGVPRLLSNRGEVTIAERRFPIAGRVCMDMTMVHLGSPSAAPPVHPGIEVIFFGEGGPSADEVAAWAGTISYEVLCGIAPRVPRKYVNE